jgi:hypothetical protein
MPTPSDVPHLQQRLRGIKDQRAIMRIVADEILERHHRAANAREIAKLLLDAAAVEVGP